MGDNQKIIVHSILTDVGFYVNRPRIKANISARTKDTTENFPKVVEEFLNPPLALPPIENEEESDDLEGQGMKVIIHSIFIDIWTRLEV